MWRIVRWFSWVVKGTLLLIALVAMVLWPLGYSNGVVAELEKLTPHDDRVDEVGFWFGCVSGRIGTLHRRWDTPADWAETVTEDGKPLPLPPGSHWKLTFVRTRPPLFSFEDDDPSWGPFHWNSHDGANFPSLPDFHFVALPCWMLALMAGAWPLGSLTLWLRRRRQRVPGCCVKCGYDLRASPHRCPECGTMIQSAEIT